MKTILVALAFFLLGFAAFWGYNKYQGLMVENERLRKEASSIPSSSLEPSPTIEPSDEAEEIVVAGSIEGSLGYPSEQIPPLEVYALDTKDASNFFKVKTEQNQGTYVIDKVKPGTYHVVAYPQGQGSGFTGGYSKAVPCGLSVICTDHSLIPVEVKSGQSTKGIDPKDWYAPENSFPAKPQ